MCRSFFLNKQWFLWSILGSIFIIVITWGMVELDVRITNWFGAFYNMIQKALATPNSVTVSELLGECWVFAKIAGVYILIAILLDFFTSHYIFRWRTAMTDYYVEHWPQLSHIEGASQRIQEDTMRFASIMESLGAKLIQSIMTLIAYLPLLWVLSEQVTILPLIGHVNHSLVYVSILSAIVGTVLLAVAGIKLPGLAFNIQKVEAAYRKELVLGEDDINRAKPPILYDLFNAVRKTYFTYYAHFLYFNIVKYSFLQFSAIWAYIIMAPTIVAGVITLGMLQQILRAFDRVTSAFQYLVYSWTDIVNLISIYKRLHAFESHIKIKSHTNR